MSSVLEPLVLTSSDPPKAPAPAPQPQDPNKTMSPPMSTEGSAPVATSLQEARRSTSEADAPLSASTTLHKGETPGPAMLPAPNPNPQSSNLERTSSAPHRRKSSLSSDLSRSSTLPSLLTVSSRSPDATAPTRTNQASITSSPSTNTSTTTASNACPTPLNTHTITSPTTAPIPGPNPIISNISEALDSNLRKQSPPPPANPFSKPLPIKTHMYYRQPLEPEQNYVFYTLVPLPSDNISKLKRVFKRNAEQEFAEVTIVPSPKRSDFTGATVRDVYDHHIHLLAQSAASQHDTAHATHSVAGGRFIVVLHEDWDENGVLLVQFDCDGEGSLGVVRIDAEQAVSVCLMFEQGGTWANWEDLKEWELGKEWRSGVEGYDGTELMRFGGGRMFREGETDGEAFLSRWRT